jgi:hypothetical protein
MVIQAGESDERAIIGFINDCLVPTLAKRFMSERDRLRQRSQHGEIQQLRPPLNLIFNALHFNPHGIVYYH